MKQMMFDGPIPGENYTSDTKNYPWHRPPDFTTTDQAIEYIAKVFSKEDVIAGSVSLMEMGISIATITDMYLTKGISEGKWSVDLAILLGGPVAHMLVIMAKTYGIPVKLGVAKSFKGPTSIVFNTVNKNLKKISKEKKAKLAEDIQGVADMASENSPAGFMAGAEGSAPMEDEENDSPNEVEDTPMDEEEDMMENEK